MRLHASRLPVWLIPMAYAGASILAAILLPRLEQTYFPAISHGIAPASAVAALSTAASGTMALTAIVFSIVFVMVQFSALAYSPRLVLWFARDSTLYHSLGVFVATFVYGLAAVAWTDRHGSGDVPFISYSVVMALLVLSILLFSRLVQRISDLQITNVLQLIGSKGREVISASFVQPERKGLPGLEAVALGSPTQELICTGEPRAIARFDLPALVHHARQAGAVIVMASAVGDTVAEGTVLLRVHGARTKLPEGPLLRAIELAPERTFEQDPKYPIRLLVDIAIRALSPAINDPTTAVQAIDQIEDLMRRLGRQEIEVGYRRDADGAVRVIYPMPTWEDYLALAFDEIRQYGAGSIQVMRRLRSALLGLCETVTGDARIEVVRRYLAHLDRAIEISPLDAEDRVAARQEDRQGLGLTRARIAP